MAGRPIHTFEVLRTEHVAPHMVRVVFGGNGFDTFTPGEFTDSYVKVVFVPAGVDVDALPRPLTIDSFSDLDAAHADRAHLHRAPSRFRQPGDWPSTSSCTATTASPAPWAENVKPGDPAYLMGPSGAYSPDPAADWHLFAGDEAAIPAISVALEALPVRRHRPGVHRESPVPSTRSH